MHHPRSGDAHDGTEDEVQTGDPERRRREPTDRSHCAATADVGGTEETLGKATAERLRAFYGRWYRPERATLVIVGDMDPAAQARRIEAMVAFALADVDATVEQRDRIGAIMKAAANDLQASRKLHMQARRQSMQLLTASTIDRAQLEKLRVEQMQLGDSTSRRLLQAMMDSAEVLTPEQRAKVAERWQKRTPPQN